MQGVICFNDFRGHELSERAGAELEAETMRGSLQNAGLIMHLDIRNWTTYKLFQGLREFCKNVRQSASLVVVCLMSHGEAGSLYGWDGEASSLTDRCHINDVIYILTQGLPTHIPKVSKEIGWKRIAQLKSSKDAGVGKIARWVKSVKSSHKSLIDLAEHPHLTRTWLESFCDVTWTWLDLLHLWLDLKHQVVLK